MEVVMDEVLSELRRVKVLLSKFPLVSDQIDESKGTYKKYKIEYENGKYSVPGHDDEFEGILDIVKLIDEMPHF
jgi:hypothetical protein